MGVVDFFCCCDL